MSLTKLFDSVFEFPKPPVYECSVDGCHRITNGKGQSGNIRGRWILQQRIGDEQESAIVNLCPQHVQAFFGLTEKDYLAIENGEKLASGKVGIAEWQKTLVQG